MSMSHETCVHPRTPAGRAWCRKNGGPGSGAVWGSIADDESTMQVARKGKRPALTEVVDAFATGRKSRVTKMAKTSRHVAPKLTDLPRLARTITDWANTNDVTYAIHQGRGTAVNLELARTDVGYVTITFDGDGVAASFRPVGTSISTRTANVNDALAKLKG